MKLTELLDKIKAGEEPLFTKPSVTLNEGDQIDFYSLVNNAFDSAITDLLARSSADDTDEGAKVHMICDFLSDQFYRIVGTVHAATLNKYPKRGQQRASRITPH